MASLDPAATPAALADVDVKLPVDGLARDLDLELLSDVRRVERGRRSRGSHALNKYLLCWFTKSLFSLR
jgi:hypothetical protein